MQDIHGTDWPFSAQLTGGGDGSTVGRCTKEMDGNREVFSGDKVRFSFVPYGMQSGGFLSPTGTWNVPSALTIGKAEVVLGRIVQPFSVTVDAERDSMSNSDIDAVTLLVEQAHKALGRMEEIAYCGDGTGLMATITDNAASLTTTVATTSNWDILLPGTVWDVLTVSSGADPGQGLRRTIASVVESTGVITWSTTATASDGGSGNITHANTEGIYIPGSYGQVTQGIAQASAVTGTFQGTDKALNAWWQGTDGRGGDTTTKSLSDSILDAAVRRGRRWGIGFWNYGMGDPAVIDLYKQGKYPLVRLDSTDTTLHGGFKGVMYDGSDRPFPLMKVPYHAKGQLELVRDEFFQLYGDSKGPDFLTDDGSMFRRFTRALPKEADLLDRFQMGVKNCAGIVFLHNLDVAS